MSKSRAAVRDQEREQDRTTGLILWSMVVAGCVLFFMSQANAAVGVHAGPQQPEVDTTEIITGSIPSGMSQAVNVRMQFIQMDGPRAGHVKVVLTPDDHPLTMDDARSAARQAFLETLNDPFFNDDEDLKIVSVVVHRFPGQDDPELDFEVQFRYQGEGRWSVQD